MAMALARSAGNRPAPSGRTAPMPWPAMRMPRLSWGPFSRPYPRNPAPRPWRSRTSTRLAICPAHAFLQGGGRALRGIGDEGTDASHSHAEVLAVPREMLDHAGAHHGVGQPRPGRGHAFAPRGELGEEKPSARVGRHPGIQPIIP